MGLASHGRFGFQPIGKRPAFEWPGGARLAVYLSVNIEHFAYGEGLGLSYTPGLPHPNTYNWGWREYGNRVGIWRIMELAREHGLPLSAMLNAEVCEHAPDIPRALIERGDEIVGHGRTNSEHQNDFDELGEARLIAEATKTLTDLVGEPPKGWLSPGINPSVVTTDLVAEAGYDYILDWPIDDQPVWMTTRNGGRILSVPYPQEINDIPFMAVHNGSAEEFADAIIANFTEMVRQAETQPLVFGVSVHTFLTGQPHHLFHMRRALDHIAQNSDRIWLTTTGAIAGAYAAQVEPR